MRCPPTCDSLNAMLWLDEITTAKSEFPHGAQSPVIIPTERITLIVIPAERVPLLSSRPSEASGEIPCGASRRGHGWRRTGSLRSGGSAASGRDDSREPLYIKERFRLQEARRLKGAGMDAVGDTFKEYMQNPEFALEWEK